MDRLRIFQKGLVLIAVPLCFQLLFIGLVMAMRRQNIEAARWAIHSNQVIALAESCGYRILSAHGAIQGFIITRDASFGADLKRLVADSRARLRDLVARVGDHPEQLARARLVRDRAEAQLAYMEEGARLIEGPGMDPELAATRRRHAQALLEHLAGAIAQLINEERALDVAREGRLELAWRRLDLLLVGGLVLSILCSLLIAALFSRSIGARIATLAENSRRLVDGQDLRPPLGGADEIARLDEVFREMATVLAIAGRRERADAELAERRAAEMAEVNAQLRDKAREVEMFVYSVSHDLRSPLVNLQGFSKELGLLADDLVRAVDRDGVPAEVRSRARELVEVEIGESVGFIRSAVTRLGAIIDALLRLSRAGRVEYHPQVVDATPIVDRVVAALRGTIDGRRARVLVAELPPALADPTALEQVFANLIGNAVNYLDPARPGLVEVAGAPRAAAIGEPPTVVYTVADNGLGIPAAYQGKIFTAFQRLHGDVAAGEGIGLALVRRIVERNGGRIWFESEAGRGTTFSFTMPAPAPAGPDDPPHRADAGPADADRLLEVR